VFAQGKLESLMIRYELPIKSEWAQTLSPYYLREMGSAVDEFMRGWFSKKDCEEGYDEYLRACYIYGRMDQCMTSVMPWITAAIPNHCALEVLEVGCGSAPRQRLLR